MSQDMDSFKNGFYTAVTVPIDCNALVELARSTDRCPGKGANAHGFPIESGRSIERARRSLVLPDGQWTRSPGGLLTEIEAFEQFRVLGQFVALQVIEQLATATGHGEKTSAGMEILAMHPQMVGQVIDPRRKQGDLDVA